MRAILCETPGPPEKLVLRHVASDTPGAGEVVVAIEAVGLNFADTLLVAGTYQYKPELPFSPGAEFAGTIAELGAQVTNFRIGDRVMGYCGWGACREAIVVAADTLIAIPDEVPFDVAAGLIVTYGTTLYALRERAGLQPCERIAVLGASGGVGLAAIEIAVAMGAEVIACASSVDKLRTCRAHGAHTLINYSEQNLKVRLKDVTGGQGVDVIYDPVGGDLCEAAVRAIAWRGRYLVIGFAAGEIPRLPLNLVLLKSCDIRGVFWSAWLARDPAGHRAVMEQILQWVGDGTIRPRIDATYPLARTPAALNALLARKVKGKVIVVPGGQM